MPVTVENRKRGHGSYFQAGGSKMSVDTQLSTETELSKDRVDRWVDRLIAIFFGVIGIVIVKEAREELITYRLWVAYTTLLAVAGYAIWRTRHLGTIVKKLKKAESDSEQLLAQTQKLNGQLSATEKARDEAISDVVRLEQRLSESRPYKKDKKRGRWETVTQIYYGHLRYPPFLDYQWGDSPVGIGVDLLTELLGFKLSEGEETVKIDHFGVRRNWNDILAGLRNEDYDVVATPLFATFERSKEVAFTAPLFFSNVGLYVSKDTSVTKDASRREIWKDLKVQDLESVIKRAERLKVLSVEGEISEGLAKTYCGSGSIDPQKPGTLLSGLFYKIANSKDPQYALFCESFYAHLQPEVRDGKVVNVLPLHQILYPVCFAVRLGDYQLANLLNIRLLRLTQEKGGALPFVIEKLLSKEKSTEITDNPVHLTAEDVKRHFVAEWPDQSKMSIVKDGTNA
jgi:hypothetical protein